MRLNASACSIMDSTHAGIPRPDLSLATLGGSGGLGQIFGLVDVADFGLGCVSMLIWTHIIFEHSHIPYVSLLSSLAARLTLLSTVGVSNYTCSVLQFLSGTMR